MKKIAFIILGLALTFLPSESSARDYWFFSSKGQPVKMEGVRCMTFGDESINIKDFDGTSKTIDYQSCTTIWSKDFGTTSIQDIAEESIRMSLQGRKLMVENLRPGTVVSIVSANGWLVGQYTELDGQGCIDLQNLPQGIYVLKATSSDKDFVRKIILR